MIGLVIWKDVEGFEGLYRVSNEGVLMSLPRWGTKGGIVKRIRTDTGYEKYILCKDGKVYTKRVHRLLAQHFIANPENKPYINHIDGNPLNNTLDNLEWVTPKENSQHAVRTGLINAKGENHPQAKLTDQEVLEIRDLYKNKIYKQREIGAMYGVSHTHVCAIVLNNKRKAVKS